MLWLIRKPTDVVGRSYSYYNGIYPRCTGAAVAYSERNIAQGILEDLKEQDPITWAEGQVVSSKTANQDRAADGCPDKLYIYTA